MKQHSKSTALRGPKLFHVLVPRGVKVVHHGTAEIWSELGQQEHPIAGGLLLVAK